MGKLILSLDFDGVCHSYTSGWKGAANIPDDAVPGLFEFLEEAVQHFDVQIYSSRSNQEGGIEAMMAWFIDQRKKWRDAGGQGAEVVSLGFPKEKPSAFIGLDDRVLTFSGAWPDVESLKSFKPWNKKPAASEFTRNSPDYEMWAHAACLTLAEGNTDYPPIELQSLAMQTVIKVVQERDELKEELEYQKGIANRYASYASFLYACAKSGEQPETYEWYLAKLAK